MPEWGIISALVLGGIVAAMIYLNKNSSQPEFFSYENENIFKRIFQKRSLDYKNDMDIILYKKNIGVYPHPSWTFGQIQEANASFENNHNLKYKATS